MNWVEGLFQYTTGLGYLFAVGALSGYELWQRRRQGIPWSQRLMLWGLMAMAISCGPHHLDLGAHMMFYGHPITPIDLTAIILAFPWAVAWTYFRVGQVFPFRDPTRSKPWWRPRGDLLVPGDRAWPSVMLGGMIGYMVAVIVTTLALVQIAGIKSGHLVTWLPQIVLFVLYCTVGYLLWSAQYERRHRGSWSLASLSLAVIFPTCAVSHWAYATAVARGVYPVQDLHTTVADLYGVPAAAFFLFVAFNQRRVAREAAREHLETTS